MWALRCLFLFTARLIHMQLPRHTAFFSVIAVLSGIADGTAVAATYTLPTGSDTVLGEVQQVTAKHEDTFLDMGRRFGVGYEEMVAANPGVDPWLPGEGRQIVIPSRYILPDAPREGIVVSLAEHRLYYFPRWKAGETPTVITYPISVGKMDWKTAAFACTRKTSKCSSRWSP